MFRKHERTDQKQMKKIVLTMALIVIAGYAILPALTNDEIIAEFQTMRNGQLAGAADTMELPRKCGLDICVNLLNIRDQIGEALYGQLLIRPDLQAIDTTEHFIIHYATAGADTPYQASVDINPANGIPDYVDSTALIFEYVWSMEVDSLQYPIPPPDGSNGGDSRYDIYILNLPAGYYGVTYPESQVNNRQWTSYIEVDNDFSNIAGYRNRPLEAMKVTAAHEFFHSIHFGLDSYEYDYFNNQARPWWLEATAVWMEEIVYTQVNDYLSYLLYFYNYPHIGLGEFGSSGVSGTHPYASCVWPLYLDKRFGRDVIRQIWLDCAAVAGYNLLPSIDEVLSRPDSNYNSSFEFAFREFTSWNYFTATRADTINKYPEANRWPQIKRRYSFVRSPYDPAGYPMADTILASDSGPQPLAANYIVFRPWRMPGGLRFHFNGDDVSGFTWAVNVLGWKRGGNDSLFMMNTSPGTGEGSLAIRDWSRYDSLVFIPALFGMTAGYNQYGYGFEVYYDSSLTGNVPIFDSLPYLVYVKGGDCAEVNIHATDANGDSIHIYSDSLPEGATLVDSGNGSALLRFCPDSSQAGDFVSISVRAADTGGYDERTLLFAVESLVVVLPSNNVFAEIYPNPIVYSEGETDTIRYFLPDSLKFGKVQIWLFSVAGDKIYEYEEKISDNNPKGPGYHKIPWDCKNSEHNLIAGGIYFIKIKAGDRTGVGKFAVIR
jgi:hypothetical protein